MGFAIGRTWKRARWLCLFVVTLLGSSAIPVLAGSSPAGDVVVVSGAEAEALPSPVEIAEGIAEAEERQAREEELRETPAAEQEREESRLAYADLSATDAAQLLRSEFGEQLALIDEDPARALTEAQLQRPVGPTGALVEVEGDPALIEGTMPVRLPDEGGELRKVSLELAATPDGSFVTENGLVDLELPRDASQPMQIGERGLAIEPVLPAGESVAQRFGEKDLLYPEVLEATDLLATPISTGLEISALLRSQESPEELRFALTLPAGAELRPDGEGGAQIVRDGQVLAGVRTPSALDAQGADVPVSMQIQKSELVLSIEHREMDLAYPALLDPIVDEWYGSLSWYAGYNLQGLSDGSWGATSNDYGRFKFETQPWYSSSFEGSNRGLFISYQGGTETQWAYRHGAWVYTVPGSTTYITDAGVSPFWRHNNGCSVSQYPKPHDYVGLWSNEWSQWVYHQPDAAQTHKQAFLKPPSDWRGIIAEQLHIGLGVGIYNTAAIPCNRDVYAGGVYIWMDDLERPTLSAVGAPTSEWVSDDKPFSMTASASDAGLGVKTFAIGPQGQDTFERPSTPAQCTGFRANPCPASVSNVPISLSADRFGEGQRTATISVKDPLGEVSDTYTFITKVDRTPPHIALSGQLATATKEANGDGQDPEKWEELSLPVYNLTIQATDVGPETDANMKKRSGVKSIEVFLDENTVPEKVWTQPACDSCAMTQTYPLKLSQLTSAGKHKLKVVAVDQVEKKLSREIEFEYIPATGMKDEYVMHHFPLPDGSGNEAEEEHPDRPELAVNVMNGNLLYREQDVEVDGTATVDLEVERYYNSMLPDSENTEWGDGWTLAETPDLDPIDTGGGPAPDEAEFLDSSGAMEGEVALPSEAGAKEFDPALQATLEKTPGGYELTDETGESATSVHFDETGQTEALLTEGFAKVDYSYEGGELAEIEVIDPSTFATDPAELQIPKPQLLSSPVYASASGSQGSGNSQFQSPADVAVDGAGNLYVVDRGNNRIQKFDAEGKFVSQFGALGSGNGQFKQPAALAIDAAGNLYVADKGNNRIQKFTSKGEFLAKFGSLGTGNGQFSTGGPEGISVDAKGNVWVSDTYRGRLQKFTAAGGFLGAFGSKGSGLGQLGEPTGLDVAPDGKVWVADWQNNRIAVFGEAGEFVFQFGVQGAGNGAFVRPDEVEIDANGSVWVGDQGNNRIQQFNQGAEYVSQFGSYGSAEGKFSFSYPLGIATDSKGNLWVADVDNHRVQRWLVPIPKPTYISAFGTNGSGEGQLKSPADTALDHQGHLWVADRANHRVQKFTPSGKFLATYGSLGSGDGQFNEPSSIAVDRDGNVLVADTGNHRIQKLNPAGEFQAKFGSLGSGDGQLNRPEEVVADKSGNVWVADRLNGRVQQFDEEGSFVKVLDSGQLFEPTGIDVTAGGFVLVADWQANRVSIFSSAGEFKNNIGSEGSGNGQFNHPDAIEVDQKGNVWVSDRGNHRIQRFNLFGVYVGQFGAYGSGPGQFNLGSATGMTSDREGRLWIADPSNHRVQQWRIANYAPAQAPPLDLSDGDAAVEVEAANDLITGLTGNAAGEHSYEHEGDFLVSHDGPEGETVYEKDASGRLGKVTLPNGNWAAIEYEAALGRVKKVSVSIGGAAAKVTEFEYKDGPRSTTVIPPDAPAVTYDIGADGSVLKWWHVAKPPEFLDIGGSLWAEKETEVEPGDQTLKVVADSPHGISSIKFIANGNQLVDEKTCAQTEAPGIECEREENLWVTDTADHAPGILHLEAIVTNRFGESETERFWVNIPHTPPPTPGAPVPPRYKDILKFREDYGLEVVFPVANETELSERIFDLIGAWHNPHTPVGEVARSSWERWGVPLRPADLAELEYREHVLNHNSSIISQWGQSQVPATYAGYYMDHPAGGKLQVGFTANQTAQIETLKSVSGLIGTERIVPFSSQPSSPLTTLASLSWDFDQRVASRPDIRVLLTASELDVQQNKILIGTKDVGQVSSFLQAHYGSSSPINAYFDPGTPTQRTIQMEGGFRGRLLTGGLLAGDYVRLNPEFGGCTLAFGAWEEWSNKKPDGRPILAHFALTAGHCFLKGDRPKRGGYLLIDGKPVLGETSPIGTTNRNSDGVEHGEGFTTDSAAIRLDSGTPVPRKIFVSDGWLQPINGARAWKPGMTLCHSGARSDLHCGPTNSKLKKVYYYEGEPATWQIVEHAYSECGDSGSPVWDPITGKAVGLLTGGPNGCQSAPTWVTPLVSLEGRPELPEVTAGSAPGALSAPDMAPLFIVED